MSLIFADTYFFVGFTNQQDAGHSDCVTFASSYRGKILTTEWILVEYANAMSGTRHRVAVGRYVQELARRPNVEVISFSKELLARGLALYVSRPDKKWSLTDCISFVVMGERQLTEALTEDRHFEQAGFKALLKA